MNWQPIDTAPKDRPILVYGPRGHGCLVVEWDDDPEPSPGYQWLTLDGPSYANEAFTHWMPLPEPPIVRNDNLATMPKE